MKTIDKRIFLSTTSIAKDRDVFFGIEEALPIGIDRFELGSGHIYNADIENKIDFLKSFNLTMHSYFPPEEDDMVINLASREKDILSKSLGKIYKSIKFSKTVNSRLYSFHPGFMSEVKKPNGEQIADFKFDDFDKASYKEAFGIFLNSVKSVCKNAEKFEVEIACENSGSVERKDFLLMTRPEEFENLFSLMDYSNLGLLLDLGHLRLGAEAHGFEPYDFITKFQKRIKAIHVHDNDGKKDLHLTVKRDGWSYKFLKEIKSIDVPFVCESRVKDIAEAEETMRIISEAIR